MAETVVEDKGVAASGAAPVASGAVADAGNGGANGAASATAAASAAPAAGVGTGAGQAAAGSGDAGKGTAAGTGAAPAADAGEKKGVWPEDWQRRFAGEDEKELKQVSRYASPEEVWKKARALERRLSSGELRPTLPKDPKPDELKAWRKDNGIPEKPDGYDLKGVEIPETDRPIINDFLTRMHSHHATPEVAREAVRAYYDIANRNLEARHAADEKQRVETLDVLNQEYGAQFRRNVNLVEGVLSKFPQSVRDAIKSARLPDGTAAFNHPDVVRGFLSLALEMNPAGIVVPSSGGDLAKSMTERYTEIQKYRREDRGAYNKDTKVQEEERQIIDAMMKHGLMDQNGNLTERKAA